MLTSRRGSRPDAMRIRLKRQGLGPWPAIAPGESLTGATTLRAGRVCFGCKNARGTHCEQRAFRSGLDPSIRAIRK